VHRQTLRFLFLVSSVLEFSILTTADLVTMKNRVFSETWRRVGWQVLNVSEKCAIAVFRVETAGSSETSRRQYSPHSPPRLPHISQSIHPHGGYSKQNLSLLPWRCEDVGSSETPVHLYHTTLRHIPRDSSSRQCVIQKQSISPHGAPLLSTLGTSVCNIYVM